MEKAKKFEDLILWQKAHSIVLAGYKLSNEFPKEEVYGLTSQFRRALISIPANIAEGFAKESPADKARFLNIAQGSLEEVKYYLILINDLRYGKTQEMKDQLSEIGRILNAYRNSILKRTSNS